MDLNTNIENYRETNNNNCTNCNFGNYKNHYAPDKYRIYQNNFCAFPNQNKRPVSLLRICDNYKKLER